MTEEGTQNLRRLVWGEALRTPLAATHCCRLTSLRSRWRSLARCSSLRGLGSNPKTSKGFVRDKKILFASFSRFPSFSTFLFRCFCLDFFTTLVSSSVSHISTSIVSNKLC
ncbi:hypothetical protein GmHk_13G036056 [Glycine max]|nr:hypothetical protein GmHk_13G036056 [Glycine max]